MGSKEDKIYLWYVYLKFSSVSLDSVIKSTECLQISDETGSKTFTPINHKTAVFLKCLLKVFYSGMTDFDLTSGLMLGTKNRNAIIKLKMLKSEM